MNIIAKNNTESIKKDLTLMQDDKHYFGEIGRKYLSKSSAGALLGDVREFLVPKEDNINFKLGSYFHHLLIEPDKATLDHVLKSSTRTTKVYKDYCAINNISFAVLQSEKENIELCAKAMQALPEFNDLIYNIDAEYEVPGIKEINGFLWKGKCDVLIPDLVIDLKTTVNLNRFKYTCYDYHYDLQAYLYREIFGKEMLFLVVCKKTATCGIFECSDEFYNSGEFKAQRAVEQYEKYYGKNATHDPNLYYIKSQL